MGFTCPGRVKQTLDKTQGGNLNDVAAIVCSKEMLKKMQPLKVEQYCSYFRQLLLSDTWDKRHRRKRIFRQRQGRERENPLKSTLKEKVKPVWNHIPGKVAILGGKVN